MKIGIAQCDVRSGDIAANAAKIAEIVKSPAGADLWVAPLFALTGPLPDCVLRNPDFARALCAEESVLARALEGAAPVLYGASDGPRLLQGGAAMSSNGDFFIEDKRICPFAAESFAVAGGRAEADLLCCTGAVPFAGSRPEYEDMRLLAISSSAPLVFANLCGGCDERIYGGASCAIDAAGRMRHAAPEFSENCAVIDFMASFSPLPEAAWNRTSAILDALILGTRDFVRKCGASAVVLGLSGGMDSALVAAIAVEALGADNVTGLVMPSPFSSAHSITDALELAGNLGMRTLQLPITDLLAAFEKTLQPAYDLFEAPKGDLTRQNLQARMRAVLLSAVSNRSGALILNTGNKSEAAMGYFTLYGDSAGALAVIGDVYKTEVYRLAREFNRRRGQAAIPENICAKSPSAELAPDQKDTDSLPPYDLLDPALEAVLQGSAQGETGVFTRGKLFANEFKRRQCPPVLVVSTQPLSDCRRPIAGKIYFGRG